MMVGENGVVSIFMRVHSLTHFYPTLLKVFYVKGPGLSVGGDCARVHTHARAHATYVHLLLPTAAGEPRVAQLGSRT